MAIIKKYIFLLPALILFSCSSDKEKISDQKMLSQSTIFSEYPFREDLELYLKSYSNSSFYDTIFFVPINSCELCVKHTLNAMKVNNYSDLLILGGKEQSHPEFQEIIQSIRQTATVISDSSYQMTQYNLDIFGPTLIIKFDNKCKYTNIEYKNLPLIIRSLKWK